MDVEISDVSTNFYVYGTGSAPSNISAPGGVVKVTGDTVPYMPLTATATEVSSHVTELIKSRIATSSFPIFTVTNGELKNWSDTLSSAAAGNLTYYIPYRLPGTLSYGLFGTIMSNIARQSIAPSPPSKETPLNARSSPWQTSSTNSSRIPQTLTKPICTPSGMVWANTTVPKSTHVGTAVGGSIGGLVAGIAIALIAFACLRYRESRRFGRYMHRPRVGDEDTNRTLPPTSKQRQNFEVHTDMTGWQKHLPQEKDDRTIVDAVKTIFDQVQLHVEGFYCNKPGKLTSSTAAALDRVSPEGFARRLSETPNSILILEGILVRWIVHRISLRSDAGDSFLPFEYTKIPEQNGKHMESNGNGSGQAESCKKGFPQAFAKWRTLTAFLYPNPSANQDFKKHLNVKFDQGVRTLTDAFSPWNIHGKSVANRDKSLRNILQLSNDVGVLLFAQPSTFVFDWSNKDGKVTVSPALVKRFDEYAKPVLSDSVLITARMVNL